MKFIVVGAGPGGCAAALFLHRVGVTDITVYEAQGLASLCAEDGGGGISLSVNGINVLAAYSDELAQRVYNAGYKCPRWRMGERDGYYLGQVDSGREGRYSRYGTISLRKCILQQELIAELARNRGISVHYDARVERIEQTEEYARVHLTSGAHDDADLVVGADGATSIVLPSILGGHVARKLYSGLLGVSTFVSRKVIETRDLEGLFPTGSASCDTDYGGILTFGPSGSTGLSPVDRFSAEDGGRLMWWCAFEAPERDVWDVRSRNALLEQLRLKYDGWHAPIPEILEKCKSEDLHVEGIYSSDVPKWHTRRLVLLGDAAHILPPQSGQGVAMALEDAAYLAAGIRNLVETGEAVNATQLEIVLHDYQVQRKKRCDALTSIANKRGGLKKDLNAFQCFMRRWGMRLVLPLVPTQFTDFLYDWKVPEGLFDSED